MHGIVTLDDVGDVVVVRAAGEFDRFSFDVLVAGLTKATAARKDMLVDLRRVTFMDPQSLRAIHDAREDLRLRGRALVVIHTPPVVHQLAVALKLTDIAGL